MTEKEQSRIHTRIDSDKKRRLMAKLALLGKTLQEWIEEQVDQAINQEDKPNEKDVA